MLLSWGRRSQSLPSTSNHMRCSLHGTCTVCSVGPSTASFLRGGVLLLGVQVLLGSRLPVYITRSRRCCHTAQTCNVWLVLI